MTSENSEDRPRGERIRKDLDAFRAAAARLGLVRRPGEREPVLAECGLPASEAEVAAVEDEIGRPLPATLRGFFLGSSAHLAAGWALPVTETRNAEGVVRGTLDLMPPPRFCLHLKKYNTFEPLSDRGEIRISLGEVASNWHEWQAILRDWRAPDPHDTPRGRDRTRHLLDYLERGFPVMQLADSEWLCIDTTDPRERLALMSQTTEEVPGVLLGQDLLDHLEHQGRLGFPGFEINLLSVFRDKPASIALREAYAAPYDLATVKRRRLHLPVASVTDADSEPGLAWRAWLFGLDSPAASA